MENKERRERRALFFAEVIQQAELASHYSVVSCVEIYIQYQMAAEPLFPSVGQSAHLDATKNGHIEIAAKTFYDRYVSKAAEDLTAFISEISPEEPLCVTYWDEADELRDVFRVIVRLLSNQKRQVKMWNIFMATKSSLSIFFPIPEKSKPYAFLLHPRFIEEQDTL
jgi:hypothetical protein